MSAPPIGSTMVMPKIRPASDDQAEHDELRLVRVKTINPAAAEDEGDQAGDGDERRERPSPARRPER